MRWRCVPIRNNPDPTVHSQSSKVSKSGEIVVIELKCTQQSRAEHKSKFGICKLPRSSLGLTVARSYRTPCKNLATLQHSGLANNEYNAHAWQCGYGVVRTLSDVAPRFGLTGFAGGISRDVPAVCGRPCCGMRHCGMP